jgi:hypothetical protein
MLAFSRVPLEKAVLALENVAFGEVEMIQDRLAVHTPSIHLFRVAPTPREDWFVHLRAALLQKRSGHLLLQTDRTAQRGNCVLEASRR